MTGSAEADDGLWISFGTAVRLIVGWFSIVIGILNLLADADRRTGEADLPFLIFHCLLIAGGIVLLAPGWLTEEPGLVGYVRWRRSGWWSALRR